MRQLGEHGAPPPQPAIVVRQRPLSIIDAWTPAWRSARSQSEFAVAVEGGTRAAVAAAAMHSKRKGRACPCLGWWQGQAAALVAAGRLGKEEAGGMAQLSTHKAAAGQRAQAHAGRRVWHWFRVREVVLNNTSLFWFWGMRGGGRGLLSHRSTRPSCRSSWGGARSGCWAAHRPRRWSRPRAAWTAPHRCAQPAGCGGG